MRRLLALAAVAAIGVVAMPAGADGSPPQPETEEFEVTAAGEVATEGFVDEVEITDDEIGIVGLKWNGDEDVEFRVRVQNGDGIWEELDEVEHTDEGPDPGSPEDLAARERRGSDFATEPLPVDDPEKVRIEVLEGQASDVELVTVTTPTGGSDHSVDAPDEANAFPRSVAVITLVGLAIALMLPKQRRRFGKTASLMALVMGLAVLAAACTPAPFVPSSQPAIISRAGWGANEGWRNCGPSYSQTISQATVHHTAGGNNYSPDQAAGIVRGIYNYHANTLGWCDIGYNFLIDKYGRIYEGRAGGIGMPVIGAHAAGFNTGAFGTAIMGNFNAVTPTNVSIDALVRLLVWKMSHHGMNPNQTVWRNGVPYDTIVAHRDVNATSCPGTHVYSRMGEIRNRVKPNVSASPFGRLDTVQREGSQVTVRGWGIDPKTSANIPVHIYVGGPAGVGRGHVTTANVWRPDVGAVYPQWGNNRGFEAQVPIRGPRNQVCAYLINSGGGGNTSLGCRSFAVPFGSFDTVNREGSNVRVRGWGIDPGTTAQIPVHVYVGGPAGVGHGVPTTANVWRPDVGAVYPQWGNNRGFEILTPIRGPNNQVCVYLIIDGLGPHTFLGCRGF